MWWPPYRCVRSPFGLGFFLVRGSSFQNTGSRGRLAVPLLYHIGAGPAIFPRGWSTSSTSSPADIRAVRSVLGRHHLAADRAPPSDRLQLELEVDLLRASGLVIVPLPDERGSIALASVGATTSCASVITDDVPGYTDYQSDWTIS